MNAIPAFYGDTTAAVFEQVKADFNADPNLLTYEREIIQDDRTIIISIEIDPGGGFEGGYETTTIISALRTAPACHFKIHHESILDEIGKLFGMQDVLTGYPEFDKRVVVKTDNPGKVKELFESPFVRTVFDSLTRYSFGTTKKHFKNNQESMALEFVIETALFDAAELEKIYSAFLIVLNSLETNTA
jgi:hypothetical protein